MSLGIRSRDECRGKGRWEAGAGNDREHWTCKNRATFYTSEAKINCGKNQPDLDTILFPFPPFLCVPGTLRLQMGTEQPWGLSPWNFHSSEGGTQGTGKPPNTQKEAVACLELMKCCTSCCRRVVLTPSWRPGFAVCTTRFPTEMNNGHLIL